MTDEISLEEYQKLTKRAKYGNRKVEADGLRTDRGGGATLTTSWIAGLMSKNTDALGFLPFAAIDRYVMSGQYVMQTDQHGNNIGYLLHGKPTPGSILTVAQHCIEEDKRFRGYGRDTFQELLSRAERANCRAIKVRCAADLPSNAFWLEMGFQIVRIDHRANRRNRDINVMLLDLWPTLFGELTRRNEVR